MSPVVVGNAGHCPGLDSGAVGPSGLQECDVAKDITEKVLKIMQTVGYIPVFVQRDDLQEICDVSNQHDADLFFSVHCNAAENPAATGMEIFTTIGQTAADYLATCVMNQLSKCDPLKDLPVRADWVDGDVDKEANFYVLRRTNAPAVLIEVAFITNPDEEAILASEENRTMIAEAIARGLTDYWATR